MKPSERLFRFPIKLYHSFYLNKIQHEEERDGDEHPREVPWIRGWARVPIYEITGWFETFSRGVREDEFEQKGCDILLVQTEKQGDFMCMYNMKEFEQKYNDYYEKYEEWIEDKYVDSLLEGATSNTNKVEEEKPDI